MKPGDLKLIDTLKLEDLSIKPTKCYMCEDGDYIFQRVINAKGVPYSIVVCGSCGFEIFSLDTEKEQQLIDYVQEKFGKLKQEGRA